MLNLKREKSIRKGRSFLNAGFLSSIICMLPNGQALAEGSSICKSLMDKNALATCKKMLKLYPGVYSSATHLVAGSSLPTVTHSDNGKMFIISGDQSLPGSIVVDGASNIAFVGVTNTGGAGPLLTIADSASNTLDYFIHTKNGNNLLFKNFRMDGSRNPPNYDLRDYLHIQGGSNITFDQVKVQEHASIGSQYIDATNVGGKLSFKGCVFDHGSSNEFLTYEAFKLENCDNFEFIDTDFNNIDFSHEMFKLNNPRVFTFSNTSLTANTNIALGYNYTGLRINFLFPVDNVAGRFEGVSLRRGSDSWPTNWPEIIITGSSGTNGNIIVQGSSFQASDIDKRGLSSLNAIDVASSSSVHISPSTTGAIVAISPSLPAGTGELVLSTRGTITSKPQSSIPYLTVAPVAGSDQVLSSDHISMTSPVMKVTSTTTESSSSLSIRFGVTSTSALPTLLTANSISNNRSASEFGYSGSGSGSGTDSTVGTVLGSVTALALTELVTLGVSGYICSLRSPIACKVFKYASFKLGTKLNFYRTAMGTGPNYRYFDNEDFMLNHMPNLNNKIYSPPEEPIR
ncbi:hypothetical protein GZ77_01850 [Endozoicomonas montiporae]|uniref:Uncharacterized protein n=2 Tax=Endozoicomonas montiporae TaxID=1027273 RepID=A0A081NAE3_9GAMM|nr:hypothetical protein [Endozoicomonas montiporae]KEQ15416.1 hypothetical protein GZ77_01850 [Endozoicomonas montiporae]